MSSLQYQNNMSAATSSNECQDGKNSLVKTWSSTFRTNMNANLF